MCWLRPLQIPDTALLALNRSAQKNDADSILYKGRDGTLHTIDLETCAQNYSQATGHKGNCIGERDLSTFSVLLYTPGVPTKIIFRRLFSLSLSSPLGLCGTRTRRFLKWTALLDETKYTTRDLS